MTFVRCLYLVGGHGLRDLLWSRKALLFLAGALLYAGIVGITFHQVADREDNNELFAWITLTVLWQALMPLTAMYFVISAIRDEIANRTLVYLISGPVPRSAIWLGKFLAATVSVILLLMIGWGAASFAALRLTDDSLFRVSRATLWAPWLPIVAGVPAYCAIGTLLALWFKRPMIAGAVFVIGWEELVGASPGQAGVRHLTVIDSVRTLFYHRVPAAEHFRREQRLWRGAGEEFTMPSAASALEALAWLTLIALLLALVIGARKDYDSAPKD